MGDDEGDIGVCNGANGVRPQDFLEPAGAVARHDHERAAGFEGKVTDALFRVAVAHVGMDAHGGRVVDLDEIVQFCFCCGTVVCVFVHVEDVNFAAAVVVAEVDGVAKTGSSGVAKIGRY